MTAVPPDDDLQLRSKVSPHLRAIYLDWDRRRREGESVGPVPVENVLIELVEPDPAELIHAGIAFTPLFGKFYSAKLAVDKLDDVAKLPSVFRIHHEPRLEPTLDDSIPEIRASSVRNARFPFSGQDKFTGMGVVVGIIDSGINILHPAFRLPNDPTKTRIRAIFDQTQSPSVTYTKAQIEAAIASNTELIPPGTMVGGARVETGNSDHKHGTHVAGIAAGNGRGTTHCAGEYTYVGVAPEAELVIVKYNFSGWPSLKLALEFIASTAAAIPINGLPAVINMSFVHSTGPHDGTDPMDQMIDQFLFDWLLTWAGDPVHVPPVVLVAAAGNDGRPGQHAAGKIPPGGVVKRLRFELNAQKSVTAAPNSTIEICFTAPNGLGCQLIPPGNDISGGTNLALPDALTTFTEDTQNSSCSVQGQLAPGINPNARRIVITIRQSDAAKTNQPGEWLIELTNAGAAEVNYHAWIRGDQWDAFKDDVVNANTIGSPGSSLKVITVGAYHSSGKDEGKLADFSSRGPLVDTSQSQKPDVSAPGVEIASARRDFDGGCCCDCCCSDYIDMDGTSMATPHVVGAIALMLERNPKLVHQQIKTILLANARRDSFTGGTANSEFGNGKLDVLALLNDPAVRGAGPVIASSGGASVRSLPSSSERVARPFPEIPQLEEGVPLWRLLNTSEGRRLYELGRIHWEEVRALVNTEKRVAVVWHRNHGPLLLHHATRTSMLPHVPLPTELNGVEISVRAARLVSALEPYASKELIKAMHATLPLVRQLQGKTLLELVEMFETSEELQRA